MYYPRHYKIPCTEMMVDPTAQFRHFFDKYINSHISIAKSLNYNNGHISIAIMKQNTCQWSQYLSVDYS